MASAIKSYLVVSAFAVVVEDSGTSISYQPGAVFTAKDTNPSVVNLLANLLIVETTGVAPATGFTIVTGATGPTGPTGPAASVSGFARITNGTAITSTDTAAAGERMVYDPSGGVFTLNAPAAPAIGDRWGVKNRTSSAAAITISGNGSNIESPTASFSVSASFSLIGDGIAVTWEYDGTQWLVV